MMEQAHDPEMKIAERYFLGELTNDEAEAFEAHYFECPTCAEYVREEMVMIEAGREVAPNWRPKVVPIWPRPNRQWLPTAAAAVLAVALGIENFMPPSPSSIEPEIVRIQFSYDRSAAASEPVRGEMIQLDIDVPPVETPQFEITTRDEKNEIVGKRHLYPAERANESISLVLTELPAGTYNVVIEGVRENGNRSFIASYPFEVRGKSQGGRP
jgi:Putative zinc-finger